MLNWQRDAIKCRMHLIYLGNANTAQKSCQAFHKTAFAKLNIGDRIWACPLHVSRCQPCRNL